MSNTPAINLSVGRLSQPFFQGPNTPIVAKRAPAATDRAPLGTFWVYPAVNGAWIITSIVANAATWSDISGGAGIFTSLTVNPGPTLIDGLFTLNAGAGNLVSIGDDATDHDVVIGSTTGVSNMTLQAGTGVLDIDGVGATDITIGASLTTGPIIIGGVGQNGAGVIDLGISTAGQIININNAVETAANTVNISSGANTTATSTVNIGNGAASSAIAVNILSGVGTGGASTLAMGNNTRVTTIGIGNIAPAAPRTTTIAGGNSGQNDTVAILNGNPSANTQTFSVLSGTPTGSSTQVLNLGAQTTHPIAINIGSGTGLATTNIATGAAANVTTIGTTTAGSSVTLKTPATGVVLTTGAGNVANITCGTGDPNTAVTAPQGSLYLRLDGSSTSTRAYINSNGATAWVAVTTAS